MLQCCCSHPARLPTPAFSMFWAWPGCCHRLPVLGDEELDKVHRTEGSCLQAKSLFCE